MSDQAAREETKEVLVIDDSVVARTAMVNALVDAGIAASGLPGPIGATREILRRGVRVVVVDVNMPAMQGDKLVDLFRQNPQFGQLKIVLTSGMPDGEFQAVAKDSSADEVIPKQSDLNPLVQAIANLLVSKANPSGSDDPPANQEQRKA